VRIEVSAKDRFVYLLVQNPAPEAGESRHSGNHIALDNTLARLRALFGESAVLKRSRQNDIYTVTLRLPRQTVNQYKRLVSR
jgi:two-component system sensor histidine kinase AlgZ